MTVLYGKACYSTEQQTTDNKQRKANKMNNTNITDAMQAHEEFALDYGYGSTEAESHYLGKYGSTEDFAKCMCEDMYDLNKLPDIIRYNIDWEGVWEDMRIDYEVVEINHWLHFYAV